ncbi:DUF4394 domain-containing protein [Candidatus Protofrankia californiensis]|uniref:DUF4394 domain-containing protein n=1 Tax=Candidatus Protofrankia californiensis TaxID=1839754 RepID=UPI0019D0E349|nr:DUF4394 domain-containing protein [Candidatus Protofrankia californiensis]
MRRKLKAAFTAAVVAGTLGAVPLLSGQAAVAGSSGTNTRTPNLPAVALTASGSSLVSFSTRSPERARPAVPVTGLIGLDTSLVGIDYRPQDGLLYGVGNGGGVYTLDTSTGAATAVSNLGAPPAGFVAFGVDFNPVNGLLRVVSDSGLNLRHDVVAHATTVDTALSALGVTGIAYTNNDTSLTTGTTLFDIDTNLDQLAIQSPPNTGVLVATGNLGVNADLNAGFDIYSSLDNTGVSVDSIGFATLSVAGQYGLYSVNLLTGHANPIGQFPAGTVVSDVAVKP